MIIIGTQCFIFKLTEKVLGSYAFWSAGWTKK